MVMKKTLLFFLCFQIIVACFCQPYYFRHYEVEDGLSNNTVISILQDKYGFMWFGTSDGLNKYDGASFKIYRNTGQAKSIGSNSIYCLREDKEGTLWIGTEKGLYAYNRRKDNFDLLNNVPKENIRDICIGANNTICFIAGGQLFFYNIHSKKLSKKILPGISDVISLHKNTEEEGLWLGTSSGKIALLKNNHIRLYNVSEKKLNSIEAIAGFQNNLLLIGTSAEGLKIFNTATRQIFTAIAKKNTGRDVFVRGILQNSDSSFFISTENGLYHYNILKNNFERIAKELSNPYSLSDNALYGLCKDKEGGTWIGSYFGGINYLPKGSVFFEKYFPGNLKHSLSGRAIREIVKDSSNNLWIGSEDGGLTKYNPQQNLFTKFYPNAKNGLSSSNIHGLLALNNTLLIGTFEYGMDVMDLKKEKVVKNYKAGENNSALKSNFINKIFKTSKNEIIVCTAFGLYNFDLAKGMFILKSKFSQSAFYSAIFEDSKGTVWVGTHNNGLFFTSNNTVSKYELKINGKDIFKTTRIVYITEDSFKKLWVCTIDGLYCINPANGTYKVYNTTTGFPGNIVYTLVQDNKKNYWVATSGGLVNINHITNEIKVFTTANGLLNNQFNFQSAYKDRNGDILFGSIKGIIRFNPESFQNDNYIPPIYFTNLQFADTTVPTEVDKYSGQSLMFANKLELPYKQSTFSIEFAALSFSAPSNIIFEYKINKSQWYKSGTNRKILFTNLAPGKHTITVRSTNGGGIWVNNDKTIQIEILPPFWRTNLAYFVYVSAFFISIILVLNFYTKRQKQKQQYKMELFALEKEKELYKAKMEFFTNVTHEIKTPLTLIKLPLEKITNALSGTTHLTRYLTILNKNTARLMELTHQLLDFRKIETEHYTLFLNDINLADFSTAVASSFSAMLEQRKIDFQVVSVKEKIFISADKEALTKIISNLIENSIKYCKQKIILKLEFTGNKNFVILSIENDGETIPDKVRGHIFEPFFRYNHSKTAGAGIGLSLVHSLVQLHNGQIAYSTDNDMNVFSVVFPIKKTVEENSTNHQDG